MSDVMSVEMLLDQSACLFFKFHFFCQIVTAAHNLALQFVNGDLGSALQFSCLGTMLGSTGMQVLNQCPLISVHIINSHSDLRVG